MRKLLFSLLLLNFLNIALAQHDSSNPKIPVPPPPPPPPPAWFQTLVVDEMPILAICDSLDVPFDEKRKCSDKTLLEYIKQHINYPESARKKNVQGKVIIQFIVNTDGSLSDVHVIKSVHPALDDEALRLVKMLPAWRPGYVKGEPVRVQFNLPIRFKLQ